MSPKLLPEPERWSERAGGAAAEDAIGASLKRIRAATDPSDAAAARWARQAMAPAARRTAVPLWAAALAGTVLAAGAAAAGIAWHTRVVNSAARAPHEEPPPGPRDRRRDRENVGSQPAASATEVPGAPVAPAPEPLPAPEPTVDRPAMRPAAAPNTRRRLARAVVPTVAPPGPASPTEPPPARAALGEDEAQLVARAFRHLRNEGDAKAALAALDDRDRRFGAGGLTAEAALARVEALLLLGRAADALPVLLAIRGERAGQTPEVRATRAELLVNARRCGEAAADFEALLAPVAPATTRERALYARASCGLQSAQPARAIPDLEGYLAQFPDGPSAPAVRAALERLRRP